MQSLGLKVLPPSGRNKSRIATIIGVVSALGGLALIILGTLVINSVKRSRQLASPTVVRSQLAE